MSKIQNPNSVTCFMLYYGRKTLAEEAVESFLCQTYPHKRLVIVNTHPDPVYFEGEYENIEVHNLAPDTFKNLNEKYNYAFAQIKTKWFSPWDSDDLWLPWHLENLIANISKVTPNEYPMKIGYPLSLYSLENKISKIGWQMWGDCIFEVNGHLNGGCKLRCDDKTTINCDRQTVYNNKWNRYWLRIKDYPMPSFIFRRFSEMANASVWLGKKGQEHVTSLFKKRTAIPQKEPFRPHWDRDYVEDANNFMKMLEETKYNTNNILQNPRKYDELLGRHKLKECANG